MTERIPPPLVERFGCAIELNGSIPEISRKLHSAREVPYVGGNPASPTRDANHLGEARGGLRDQIQQESGDGEIDLLDLLRQPLRFPDQVTAPTVAVAVARLLNVFRLGIDTPDEVRLSLLQDRRGERAGSTADIEPTLVGPRAEPVYEAGRHCLAPAPHQGVVAQRKLRWLCDLL